MEENIKALFISYLEKNISSKDEEILIKWINKNPDSLKEFSELRQLWNLVNVAGRFNNEEVEKEWNLLLHKINKSNERKPRSNLHIWYWFPRVAAVFLLGAVVSSAVFYSIFNEKSELVYQEISTPKGARSKVTLPDGSTIWLNAGSSVKYNNQFGKKHRKVKLSGEAFFNVASNKSKVFIVDASELSIKAYGTSFNVKSYPEENTVETTLLEGKIGVKRKDLKNGKNDEVILEPNQRVVYYREHKENDASENKINPQKLKTETVRTEQKKLTYMISKGINPQEFVSWKDGKLVIASENLDEIAIMLERKYDVKIQFENEALKKMKFTGTIENETIENVIEAIGISANIDYEIEDRDIRFKEKIKM